MGERRMWISTGRTFNGMLRYGNGKAGRHGAVLGKGLREWLALHVAWARRGPQLGSGRQPRGIRPKPLAATHRPAPHRKERPGGWPWPPTQGLTRPPPQPWVGLPAAGAGSARSPAGALGWARVFASHGL